MIERKFVAENKKENQIMEYVESQFKKAGLSTIKIRRTPLGEKIIIHTSRPGVVVGKKGVNIKKLTKALKKRFELENPQVEINEIENPFLDASIVAEKIASSLERFGLKEFKSIGHRSMDEVIRAGALGVEILMSGKIPGSRAKNWRFYKGYLKKAGDVVSGISHEVTVAKLKTGAVGIKVNIMPPDIQLPDKIELSQRVITEEESDEKKGDEKEGEEKKSDEEDEKEDNEKRTETKKEAKNEKKVEEEKEGEGRKRGLRKRKGKEGQTSERATDEKESKEESEQAEQGKNEQEGEAEK